MQLNMRSRIEMTPRKRARWMWLILLSCILAGCAGGSGSSGFDVLAENAAIQQALDSQDCEVFEGLTICAAGGKAPPTDTPVAPAQTPTGTPRPTNTARPTSTALSNLTATPSENGATPTPTGTPIAKGTATPSPTFAGPSATDTQAAAPTPTPTLSVPNSPTPSSTTTPGRAAVETNTSPSDTLPCVPNSDTTCTIVFVFSPVGQPSSAAYRVAVRTRNPDSVWRVVEAPNNRALIEVSDANPGQQYQFVVLVFSEDPGPLPETVQVLAETGADSAFVTPVVVPTLS